MVNKDKNSQSAISRGDSLNEAGAVSLMSEASALVGVSPQESYRPLEPRKKLQIGVVGGGFAAEFPWNEHPNCEVTAVAASRDDNRKILKDKFKCSNAYAEFHPMLKDPKVDAVAIFTGSPSHAPYCVDVMNAGKHVVCAVPAAISLEQCHDLVQAVKNTGMIYMNAETSCFHAATMEARKLREQGKFGRIFFSEGAYLHDLGTAFHSGNVPPDLMPMLMNDGKPTWRVGNPPGLYITHASGPVIYVTGEKLTEVSAIGVEMDHLYYKKNQYNNPFINGTFFFKTSGGNSSRISIHWWTTEPYREGADYYGTEASFYEPWMGRPAYISYKQSAEPEVYKVDDHSSILPPSLRPYMTKGHEGAEAFIVNEFVTACLEGRAPMVDVYRAVAFAAPGICGHQSALRNGEWIKVPDFGPI